MSEEKLARRIFWQVYIEPEELDDKRTAEIVEIIREHSGPLDRIRVDRKQIIFLFGENLETELKTSYHHDFYGQQFIQLSDVDLKNLEKKARALGYKKREEE